MLVGSGTLEMGRYLPASHQANPATCRAFPAFLPFLSEAVEQHVFHLTNITNWQNSAKLVKVCNLISYAIWLFFLVLIRFEQNGKNKLDQNENASNDDGKGKSFTTLFSQEVHWSSISWICRFLDNGNRKLRAEVKLFTLLGAWIFRRSIFPSCNAFVIREANKMTGFPKISWNCFYCSKDIIEFESNHYWLTWQWINNSTQFWSSHLTIL